MRNPRPLIGPERATDLATNAVLPWLWARAHQGGQSNLGLEVERRYHRWPLAQDNALLRRVRQRLFPGSRLRLLHAAQQQGLIQIARDFCENADALCRDCPFPTYVGQWSEAADEARSRPLDP